MAKRRDKIKAFADSLDASEVFGDQEGDVGCWLGQYLGSDPGNCYPPKERWKEDGSFAPSLCESAAE